MLFLRALGVALVQNCSFWSLSFGLLGPHVQYQFEPKTQWRQACFYEFSEGTFCPHVGPKPRGLQLLCEWGAFFFDPPFHWILGGPSSVKKLVSCSCLNTSTQVPGCLNLAMPFSLPTPHLRPRSCPLSCCCSALQFPLCGDPAIPFPLLEALPGREEEVGYTWSSMSRMFCSREGFQAVLFTVLPLVLLNLEIKGLWEFQGGNVHLAGRVRKGKGRWMSKGRHMGGGPAGAKAQRQEMIV